MNSIYKRIENLYKNNKLSAFSLLAEAILKDFSNGIFKTQEELATICYVSKATITQFAKACLCSGYRELQIRLKIEYENNFSENLRTNQVQINNNTLNNFIKWISLNKEKINYLVNKIKTTQKIYIFSSFQTNFSKDYFVEVLIEKGYNVISIDLSKDLLWLKSIELIKNNLFIFILSGRDNSTIQKVYNHFNNSLENIFTIASINWTNIIEKQNKDSILYFDNINFKRNFVDRTFLLISLFKYIENQI